MLPCKKYKKCSFEGCANGSLRKEYASLMVQLGNDVATRGVPTKLLREEFVSLMEQPRNDATLRGVPIKLLREEFV